MANCQAGMFLAYVSPLGRALVDKRLYLPESWTSDQERCATAGVPAERRSYRSKTGLALELLERALERGHLRAKWVAGDDAFGMPPSFRDGLAALGMHYVLDVPGGTIVWPLEPSWTSADYQGFGRSRKPKLVGGQRRTMEQRSEELPEEAWREITVAEGSQGPRSYQFSVQWVWVTRRRKPGEVVWAIWRCNLDGSEPRYYLSNASVDTPLDTLAYMGGVASPYRHVPDGRGVSVGPAAGLGGRCPGSPGPKCTGWCVRCFPRNGSGQVSCCCGRRVRSYATKRASRSQDRCRAGCRKGRPGPPP